MTIDLSVTRRRLDAASHAWAAIEEAQMAACRDRLAAASARWNELVARGEGLPGTAAVMSVLRLERDERKHCQVLRWLLDPLAPHGLGIHLVRHLLDAVGDPAASLPPEVLAETQVSTEVTRLRSRADVVVELPRAGATIVIEAKLDAIDQHRQAHRLALDWPLAHGIYLTRAGRVDGEWQTRRWHGLSWTEVAAWVEAGATSSGDAAALARSWARTFRAAGPSTTTATTGEDRA